MSKENIILRIFKEGTVTDNPVFFQLIGLCPVLAITTSVKNAFVMGLAFTFVLTLSNFIISLLKRFVSLQMKLVIYVSIISLFVSIVDMLLKVYLPTVSRNLGIFIPLIVVNCIIISRLDNFAIKKNAFLSMIDGFSTGVGFSIAIIMVAFVRMVLGTGTIFGFNIFGSGFKPILIMLSPAGAFLTFGMLLALIQWIFKKEEAK